MAPKERPPRYAGLNPEMIKSYRPSDDQVSTWHTVTSGRQENLQVLANRYGVPVHQLIEFNFPGSVDEHNRVIPEIVNWYLHYHKDFGCPETHDRQNRIFRGGERIAIPRTAAPAPPVAPKKEKRVISRTWSNTDTGTFHDPQGQGEWIPILTELGKKVYDTATEGGTDTREYHEYPSDFVVVRVDEQYSMQLVRGVTTGRVINQSVRYQWGPPFPAVVLFKRSVLIFQNGERKVETSTNTYPRSEIWKHTIAPDEKVFR